MSNWKMSSFISVVYMCTDTCLRVCAYDRHSVCVSVSVCPCVSVCVYMHVYKYKFLQCTRHPLKYCSVLINAHAVFKISDTVDYPILRDINCSIA